jgi:hypothetical protein
MTLRVKPLSLLNILINEDLTFYNKTLVSPIIINPFIDGDVLINGDLEVTGESYFDSNIHTGSMEFSTDSGLVTAIDMPVSSSALIGTEEGYSFDVDSLEVMRISSLSDGVGSVYNNMVNINGYLNWNGQKRVSTQFDKIDETLANITGLSVNVVAGKTYNFKSSLFVNADGTGGHKYSIGGTCTATSIIYQVNSVSNSTNLFVINSRQTSLGGSIDQAGATTIYTEIIGTITTTTSGTLTVQFAQSVANGTSSVLVGSTFTVHNME